MDHYVAYHSAKIMGRPYRASKHFTFLSGKPESYLRRTIGHSVWVIASELSRRNRPDYFLAGVFVPTSVARDSKGDHVVFGKGVPFGPSIEVTNIPRLKALRREQNNFSYGINRIRSASIISALERYRNPTIVDRRSQDKGIGALLDRAIYVNRAEASVRRAAETGELLTDRKRWVSGEGLWREASASGKALPLIFAQYRELMYWSAATKIELGVASTTFAFTELSPIFGRQRRDLVLASSGERLSNNFIRSYAVVRTPGFLAEVPGRTQLSYESSDELGVPYGLEGEARRVFVVHRTRERRLRDEKIAATLSQNGGRLVCEVPGCGFDFHATYGEVGKGYAHVHHLVPLAEVDDEGRSNKLDDLAIVCANCHAMIHQGGKCRSLSDLALSLQKGRPL